MSARDELIAGLVEHACCFAEEDAKRMVDAFARELAGQLRDQRHDGHDQIKCVPCFIYGHAAELIDPQKSEP